MKNIAKKKPISTNRTNCIKNYILISGGFSYGVSYEILIISKIYKLFLNNLKFWEFQNDYIRIAYNL